MWTKVNILVIPCAVFLFINCAMKIDCKPLDIYDELMVSDDQILHQMNEFINAIVDPKEDSGRLASSDTTGDIGAAVGDESKQVQTVDRCMLPVRKGVCRALIPRWNYDSTTKTCKEFKFGGCDGNGNNFSTRKQCLEMCGDL